jgi:hypothetical protein
MHRHFARPTRLAMAFAAALSLGALLTSAAPAQASEVVKLARLVVTGVRAGPVKAPAVADTRVIQQLPPVLIEGRRSEDGVRLASQRRGLPKAL